jgi:hypothetical protein
MADLVAVTLEAERRAEPRRRTLGEHGIAITRIRPGQRASLIDISCRGAMLESQRRLMPGASVDLLLASDANDLVVRARVLRCAVARLSGGDVWYRSGVRFECRLSWATTSEYSFPTREPSVTDCPRGGATRPGRQGGR